MATFRILLLCLIFFLLSEGVKSQACRCDREGNGNCEGPYPNKCMCDTGYEALEKWSYIEVRNVMICKECECGDFIQNGTKTLFSCKFDKENRKTCNCDANGYYKDYYGCNKCECGDFIQNGTKTLFSCKFDKENHKTCNCDVNGYYKEYYGCKKCDCGQVIENDNETRLFNCQINEKTKDKICICDAADFYIKNGRCENHDECKINNGGCEHVCKSCNGSYYCKCPEGSFLKPDQHNCQKGCSYNFSLVNTNVSSFQSPRYPEDYPNNTVCDYLLHTLPGHRIYMEFTTFRIERPWDFVTVYDGISDQSALLRNFTGYRSPKSSDPIRSSENNLYVVFKSDYLYEYKGFEMDFHSFCGRDYGALVTKGVIYSHPQYGQDKYDNDFSCSWRLEGVNNSNVKLWFTEFDLELDYNCANDSIEIFDEGRSSTSIGKFCGTKIPGEFFSTKGVLSLKFRTNQASRHWGFKALYEII